MTPCYYCDADDDACKTCIHSDTYVDPQEEITKLREQVAAQAAVIEKLREALSNCLVEHPDKPFVHLAAWRVKEALSIADAPQPVTVLTIIEFPEVPTWTRNI